MKMSAFICRLCLANNIRMHQLAGSEVQDVYEKLTNKKVQEDGRLHFACYICYYQLKKCQQLVIKSQKAEELLQQILKNSSELNLKSVSVLDRQKYGLVNALMVTNIPQENMIKTEDPDESDTNKTVVEEESHDEGTTPTKKAILDSTHNVKEDDAKSIEVKQETISGNTVDNLNKLSQTVCNGKSQQVKEDIKSLICHDCGKTCDTEAHLTKHNRKHKPVIIKPNETHMKIQKSICDEKFKESDSSTKNLEKIFKCHYCNYTCTRKGNLKIHIRIHTGERPFKCQYCDYACTMGSHLKTHIRTHTGEKPFKCQYCDYTCTQNGTLKTHIKTHTGEKPFKCQYCNYTCRERSYLKIHIRTHTKEKPFKCQYCNYTCTRPYHLKRHIRTHTGEKPFKCQYCNYTCIQNGDLKTHIRTHTGEKPFKCQYCNYSCTVNSRLKAHIKTHTGEKPYVCETCDKKFTTSSQMKIHLRIHSD